jgi:hypothetical protein
LPRFLSVRNNTNAFKSALALMTLGEGIPIHYYGDEQARPASRLPRCPSLDCSACAAGLACALAAQRLSGCASGALCLYRA